MVIKLMLIKAVNMESYNIERRNCLFLSLDKKNMEPISQLIAPGKFLL